MDKRCSLLLRSIRGPSKTYYSARFAQLFKVSPSLSIKRNYSAELGMKEKSISEEVQKDTEKKPEPTGSKSAVVLYSSLLASFNHWQIGPALAMVNALSLYAVYLAETYEEAYVMRTLLLSLVSCDAMVRLHSMSRYVVNQIKLLEGGEFVSINFGFYPRKTIVCSVKNISLLDKMPENSRLARLLWDRVRPKGSHLTSNDRYFKRVMALKIFAVDVNGQSWSLHMKGFSVGRLPKEKKEQLKALFDGNYTLLQNIAYTPPSK